MQTIQNSKLTVVVSPQGAELQSIKGQQDNLEYLWQGNPAHWGKRSPVLFPIVGALKEDTYHFEGNTYRLPRHGLARTRKFELVQNSPQQLTYELKADDETALIYPFDFRLRIDYLLIENTLRVSYNVLNLSSSADCWFSIGAHPAFNCPLLPDSKRSDYDLVFDISQTLDTELLDDVGLRSGKKKRVITEEKTLPISDNLFDDDALIFSNMKSKSLSLAKDGRQLLKVEFDDFDHLGIWSASSKAPFICIEPWLGIADHIDHDQDLKQKEGIVRLAAGSEKTYSFDITIF